MADNEELGGIHNKDVAGYKYIDFGKGADSVSIKVAPGKNAGKINILLDHSWGPSIGSIDIPGNGNGKTWVTVTAKIKKTIGVHALWLNFAGDGDDLFKVDSFKFE